MSNSNSEQDTQTSCKRETASPDTTGQSFEQTERLRERLRLSLVWNRMGLVILALMRNPAKKFWRPVEVQKALGRTDPKDTGISASIARLLERGDIVRVARPMRGNASHYEVTEEGRNHLNDVFGSHAALVRLATSYLTELENLDD